MANAASDEYGLAGLEQRLQTDGPDLPYLPPVPRNLRRPIGLIGCGGISVQHLRAYRNAGFNVVALCSRNIDNAQERRRTFFPDADVYTDYMRLLARDDIEVVDITTHPAERVELIAATIRSGKHILSQKPFVTDLAVGEQLADEADRAGINLAVNQNGRWAPHFRYLTLAAASGVIGDVSSVTFNVNFDHGWIVGTAFEQIPDLILYDFGIHWFDIARRILSPRIPLSVRTAVSRAAGQRPNPPMLASAVIDFGSAIVTMAFNGNVSIGQEDRTSVAGTLGSIISTGPNLSEQSIELTTSAGTAAVALRGTWFLEGFQGSMAELLCAIDDNRVPENNARDNLQSLALCFAAIAAAVEGTAKQPGSQRKLPDR